jgi:hypothetical protein
MKGVYFVPYPNILQFSPERCGSTMIYQYLKNLFPKNIVFKVHDYVAIRPQYITLWVMVTTVRDFRDAIASRWRVDQKTKFVAGEMFMTEEEIKDYAEQMNKKVKDMDKFVGEGFKSIVLKYEDFYQNFDNIHSKLLPFLQLTISEEEKQKLENIISIETNKSIAHNFENFSQHDAKSQIHGDHIYNNGEPGFWKTVIKPEHHNLINGLLEKSLKRWAYEI